MTQNYGFGFEAYAETLHVEYFDRKDDYSTYVAKDTVDKMIAHIKKMMMLIQDQYDAIDDGILKDLIKCQGSLLKRYMDHFDAYEFIVDVLTEDREIVKTAPLETFRYINECTVGCVWTRHLDYFTHKEASVVHTDYDYQELKQRKRDLHSELRATIKVLRIHKLSVAMQLLNVYKMSKTLPARRV